MMRSVLALFLSSFCFLTTGLRADDAPHMPQTVSPHDPHLRYSGRWDTQDPAGPRAMWSACSVALRVFGTAVNVALGGQPGNAFQVVVDGKATSVITLTNQQTFYPVVNDLPKGEHTVELWKRTEALIGMVQVKGFQLPSDAKLLDLPDPNRRLEFIGDSITAGYGNEAASQAEPFKPQTENAWMTWAAIAARSLHAELMCEAQSGIWLMENGRDEPMPKRWDRIFSHDPASLWDFTKWQPDAVVVNLGTNDSSRPIDPKIWQDTYRAFISRIRAVYPKAHIFLTIGSMSHGPNGILPGLNSAIAQACQKDGDSKVHAVTLANQEIANGIGANWHPSVKTHQIMAETIAAAISKELGW